MGKGNSGRKYSRSNHGENAKPAHEKNFCREGKGGKAGGETFC